MNIIKVDPFRGFDGMFRRMNEIVDEVQRGGLRFEMGDFAPRVDIRQNAEAVTIHAELPGLTKDDVKITLSDDRILTIRGEKKREETSEETNYLRVERSYGSFTRSFNLPEHLRTDAVTASFDNGVLTITVPKAEPVVPKEQEISIN